MKGRSTIENRIERLLAALNPVQRDAVTHEGGPLLILAGAGSGKTRVLTYRIAYLLETGQVKPQEILAITFTNKAADEMKERVFQLVGSIARGIWISTFHAACARILRAEIQALGYKRTFSVYDDRDSYRLVTECLKELNIDPKQYTPSAILNQISLAKNELLGYEEYAAAATTHFEKIVAQAFARYQEKLYGNNALDFDDLLVLTVRLFQLFPNVLEKYRTRFRSILVDEYQDTNHAQYVLVKMLAEKHRNLVVVGDDDQSVYGWRGADVRNILDFESDFPEARVIRLEQNYRSTQVILEAANYVISHNTRRKPKTLWTTNARGEAITAYQAEDEYDEARFVAGEIERLRAVEGARYRDIAVFYRVNAQSRVLEEVMMRHGIPYRIVGGVKFYERAEIKDMLAYLRLLINPDDDISLKRVINAPRRGIGQTTLAHLEMLAARNRSSLYEAVRAAGDFPLIAPAAKRALKAFVDVIEDLKGRAFELTPPHLIEEVAEKTGYLPALKEERTIEAEGRIENIKELINVAYSFVQLYPDAKIDSFLERVSLISDIDTLDAREDAITLMTLHNAKGLEFPVVFIVGLEDGLFPHSRSLYDQDQLEEERRLCYVGITRAKERLYLTHAWRRRVYGEYSWCTPSRFLSEIPSELVEPVGEEVMASTPSVVGTSGAAGRREVSAREGDIAPPSRAPAPPKKREIPQLHLRAGDRVRHRQFGEGTVTDVKPGGRVTVDFDDHGQKTLLLDYAPLEKL
jgi:DNA helicase-2/ATP-dependent DNA helicase PcrA